MDRMVLYGQLVPLDPTKLGLGGGAYYRYNETHPRIKAYKNYMATIATLLNVTAASTERFVRNTLAVERQLVEVRYTYAHTT